MERKVSTSVFRTSSREGHALDLANYRTSLSIGYKASALAGLVEFGEVYCDFKPVDWVIQTTYGSMKNLTINHKDPPLVEHLGEVSSREGRVDNEQQP